MGALAEGRSKGTGSPQTLIPLIQEFFGLKPSCDLYREPLFLRRTEIQDEVLRSEGKHYLDCMSGEHLHQAVELLREESARQVAHRNQ